MSNVINRTTLQYLTKVNTPDYPTEDWIINPDLSALGSVDSKYWKIDGDSVIEMSQAEKDVADAADLPALKTARYLEIDVRTGELISGGFLYAGLQFSLSTEAQARLMGINQVRENPAVVYPITWNNLSDTITYDLANAAEVLTFYLTAVGTYRAHVDSGTALKNQIRAAANKAAVDAVVDNR